MPLSPELKPIIEELARMPFFNTMPITEARRIIAEIGAGGWSEPLAAVCKISERTIDGPAGPIQLRVYHPKTDGPHPLMVYFHGGGFALGNLDTDDTMCRCYCAQAECVVVSVDYRLAPEHKFPAAPNDCYAAVIWAMGKGAAELNIDPARCVTAGMSSGGNLATVVAIMLRDRQQRQVAGQLLVVPVTDCAGEPETASYAEFAVGYMLPAIEMYWFWDMYTDRADRHHPYAAPLRAQNLSTLPPALVITAECDVLRDEGEAYAKRLIEAGVVVTAKRYEGINHLVCAFTSVSPISRNAVADQIQWLRKIFATK